MKPKSSENERSRSKMGKRYCFIKTSVLYTSISGRSVSGTNSAMELDSLEVGGGHRHTLGRL